MAVKIRYKGVDIAAIEPGKTTTVKCGGKKMKTDVSVTAEALKLQEKTVTENGEVTPDSGFDGLSKVAVNVAGGSVGGEQPTLFPPSISLDGDILTITPNAENGAFATSYDLYDNGVPVENYTSTEIDMSTLSLPSGVRHYTVKAKGEHFNDSAESNEVTRVTTLGDIMKSADGSTLTSSDGYKISVKKG